MANGQIGWGTGALSLLTNAAILGGVVAATVVGAETLIDIDIDGQNGQETVGSWLSDFWEKTGQNWLNQSYEFVSWASGEIKDAAVAAGTWLRDGVVYISDSIGQGFFDTAADDNVVSNAIEQSTDSTYEYLTERETGKAIAGTAGVATGVYTAKHAMGAAAKGGHVATEMARRAAAVPFNQQRG